MSDLEPKVAARPTLGVSPVDGTDEEIQAWAESFVRAVLGELGGPADSD
jgi:hypothetical protein